MAATISTIKPAGGGDYTTLQGWEDWLDDQAIGDGQYAECYAGGDMGEVAFSGGVVPTATEYVKIYTPLAERHDFKDSAVGAYMVVDSLNGFDAILSYTRIEGIRIENTTTRFAIAPYNNTGIRVDSNLILCSSAVNQQQIRAYFSVIGTWTVDIWNNVIYGFDLAIAGISVNVTANAGATVTGNVTVYNNTVHESTYGIYFSETGVKGGVATLNALVKNNICTDNTTADYFRVGAVGTVTGSYNLSSDLTGDDWGATGALISKAAADQYENVTNDLRIKSGADAENAGNTIADFDWDALHVDADNWRPQGASWDMGGFEIAVAVTGPLLGAVMVIE